MTQMLDDIIINNRKEIFSQQNEKYIFEYYPSFLQKSSITTTQVDIQKKPRTSYTYLFENKQDTNPSEYIKGLYDKYIYSDDADTIYGVVKSINNNKVIVELYLKSCEIQKELDEYYVTILKENNLFYVGANFFIKHKKIKNGVQICLEPYIKQNDKTLYDLSKYWSIRQMEKK